MELDIKTMTRDQLAAIVEGLQSEYSLTTEQVLLALAKNPTAEMKRIVDLVHTFLCTNPHNSDDPKATLCHYYEEELLEDTWHLPAHEHWFLCTTTLMKESNILTEKGLLSALQKASEAYTLATNTPGASHILLAILHSQLAARKPS